MKTLKINEKLRENQGAVYLHYRGVAYVIPWPLLVNQGFYIPKCLYSRVDFKNGSCHFFLLTFKVKVKGQSHGFRIYGTTYYVTDFGSFSVKRSPKPGYTDRRYLTANFNATFK